MATQKQWKKWEKDMLKWAKQIVEWQRANPEKDWLTELSKPTTQDADGGGDRPPLPPPKP